MGRISLKNQDLWIFLKVGILEQEIGENREKRSYGLPHIEGRDSFRVLLKAKINWIELEIGNHASKDSSNNNDNNNSDDNNDKKASIDMAIVNEIIKDESYPGFNLTPNNFLFLPGNIRGEISEIKAFYKITSDNKFIMISVDEIPNISPGFPIKIGKNSSGTIFVKMMLEKKLNDLPKIIDASTLEEINPKKLSDSYGYYQYILFIKINENQTGSTLVFSLSLPYKDLGYFYPSEDLAESLNKIIKINNSSISHNFSYYRPLPVKVLNRRENDKKCKINPNSICLTHSLFVTEIPLKFETDNNYTQAFNLLLLFSFDLEGDRCYLLSHPNWRDSSHPSWFPDLSLPNSFKLRFFDKTRNNKKESPKFNEEVIKSEINPYSQTFLAYDYFLKSHLSYIKEINLLLNIDDIENDFQGNIPIIGKIELDTSRSFLKLDSIAYEALNFKKSSLQIIRLVNFHNKQNFNDLSCLSCISGLRNHHVIINFARNDCVSIKSLGGDSFTSLFVDSIEDVMNLFVVKNINTGNEKRLYHGNNSRDNSFSGLKDITPDSLKNKLILKMKKWELSLLNLNNAKNNDNDDFHQEQDCKLFGTFIYFIDVIPLSNLSINEEYAVNVLKLILEKVQSLVFPNDALTSLNDKIYLYFSFHGRILEIKEKDALDTTKNITVGCSYNKPCKYSIFSISKQFCFSPSNLLKALGSVARLANRARSLMFLYCNVNPKINFVSNFIKALYNNTPRPFESLALILNTHRETTHRDVNSFFKIVLLTPLILWDLLSGKSPDILPARNLDIKRLVMGGEILAPTPIGFSSYMFSRNFRFYLLNPVGWDVYNPEYTYYLFDLKTENKDVINKLNKLMEENNNVDSSGKPEEFSFNFVFLQEFKKYINNFLPQSKVINKITFEIYDKIKKTLHWSCEVSKSREKNELLFKETQKTGFNVDLYKKGIVIKDVKVKLKEKKIDGFTIKLVKYKQTSRYKIASILNSILIRLHIELSSKEKDKNVSFSFHLFPPVGFTFLIL